MLGPRAVRLCPPNHFAASLPSVPSLESTQQPLPGLSPRGQLSCRLFGRNLGFRSFKNGGVSVGIQLKYFLI